MSRSFRTELPGSGLAERAAAWPWWLQVSLIYIAARIVSACIFMAAALHQGVNPWYSPSPGYWEFIAIWDGHWYAQAADNGYPSVLPLNSDGSVAENTWAFYALFPALGRGLSLLTGLETLPALTIVALLAGLGAALVVFLLFREFADRGTALWGVVFFAAFPVSAVLQVPYAEPLNLLLLAAALLLVVRRRYLAAMPVVVLMCLSRPTGVPFAAMAGIFLVRQCWLKFVRGRAETPAGRGAAGGVPGGPPDNKELAALAGLTVVSVAAALAWPLLAWVRTGDLRAYTRTETAWRGDDLVPFKPWFDTGQMLFGPVLGVMAPFLFAGLFALLLMSPPVRAIGTELRLWCACYMGYLLVFLHPQTSTFRLLLPLFPLALGAALLSRSRAYRGTVTVMFTLLQIVWIVWLWAWAQLPGGGDYPP